MAFLDNIDSIGKNISKTVSQTYKIAAKKSGELIEEAKLKLNLTAEKEKADQIYQKIGKIIYEAYKNDVNIEDIFIEDCKNLDKAEENILDINLKILQLKNIKSCDNCKNEINSGAQFCPKCGVQQGNATTEDVEEPDYKLCPKCGYNANLNDKYCSRCGKTI